MNIYSYINLIFFLPFIKQHLCKSSHKTVGKNPYKGLICSPKLLKQIAWSHRSNYSDCQVYWFSQITYSWILFRDFKFWIHFSPNESTFMGFVITASEVSR